MPISARNQIKGTVVSVARGEAIANVELDAGAEGRAVTATIKAST